MDGRPAAVRDLSKHGLDGGGRDVAGILRCLVRALICGMPMLAAVPAHAAEPAPAREISRTSRSYPLPTLLADLARETGAELLFDERLVRGLRARRPARGRPVASALRTLLEGTGVGFRQTPDGAYVLYRLSEPDMGQDAVTAVPDILIMGRRLLNMDIQRTENDIKPYKVFTREEIDTAHRDNLGLFFRARLPANTDVVTPAQQALAGFGQPQSSIDLRGAGAKRTLVLIDGRRLPSLPGIATDFDQSDLNGVPMGAIERVEVLTSTAGGIYGQNATGGVVNVVLRRDYQGAELNVVSGITSRGDTARMRVEGRIGLSNAEGSSQFMAFGAYAVSDRLRAGQRDFTVRARARAYANDPESYLSLYGILSYTPVSNSIFVISEANAPLRFDAENGGAGLGSRFTYLPLDFKGTPEEKRALLMRNAGKVDLTLSPGASGAERSLLNNPTVLSGIVSARHQFGGDGPEIFLDGLYFRNQGELRMGSDPSGVPTDADATGNPFAQRVYLRFPNDLVFINRTRIEMFRLVGGAIVPLPGHWRAEADISYGKLINLVEQVAAPISDGIGAYSDAILTGLASADGRPALRPLEDWQAFRAALPAYVTDRPGSFQFENRVHRPVAAPGGAAAAPAGRLIVADSAAGAAARTHPRPGGSGASRARRGAALPRTAGPLGLWRVSRAAAAQGARLPAAARAGVPARRAP